MSTTPIVERGEAGTALLTAANRMWPSAPVAMVRRRPSLRRTASRTERPTADEMLFVPSAARPWLLLPAGHPLAAASAVCRFSHANGVRDRTLRLVLAAAAAIGAADRLLPDRLRLGPAADGGPRIDQHLADVLGHPVVLSIGVGTLRANRKPILQVLTPAGRTVAFVKVGDSPMARDLLAAESAALRRLDAPAMPSLHVPEVLHHDRWQDLDLLVISALPTPVRRGRSARAVPVGAMAELAHTATTTTAALGDGPLWDDLTAVARNLADQVLSRRFGAVLDALLARHGHRVLLHGAWHGDWTVWNMAWDGPTVSLWDWERYEEGMPVGADAIHHVMQRHARLRGDWDAALAAVDRIAPDLLPRLDTANDAAATVDAYLGKLCARYLLAAQGSTGAALQDRAAWLLVTLERRNGIR